jgi:hypothetical protein
VAVCCQSVSISVHSSLTIPPLDTMI